MLSREELAKKALEHSRSQIAQISNKEHRLFRGKLKEFVEEKVKQRCDSGTFLEMPIVSSVNMLQRIINQEASIYRNYPNRTITGTDAEKELFEQVYKDIDADRKLGRGNKIFKNSKQAFLYVRPKGNKLKASVYCKHHVYVEVEDDEPVSYVILGGDLSKEETAQLTVWRKDENFIMNGKGEVISLENGQADTKTGLPGYLPFIDISDEDEKEFAFYVESDPALFDFTIELNAALSDLLYIMRQQGFAIGAVTGPKEILDKLKEIKVGPSKWLLLPTDYVISTQDGDSKQTAPVDVKFVNPSPNLQGCIDTISALLSAYLTSRGVDPKTISFGGDGKTFASGWERLLALIEKFEATKDDFEVFYRVENELFELVRAWLKSYNGTDALKYKGSISDSVTFEVEFSEPAMIETGKEKDERLAFREDRQWITKSQAMAEALGISEEDAEARLEARKPKEEVEPKTEESNEQGTDNEDATA